MQVRDTAKKKLIKFAKDHKDDMLRIREVETRVEYPMHRATVVGKIDVILHDGEGVEIRDYKTSDRVTTQDEASMQVRIYARGLAMLGDTVTRGSIAYLEDASIADVSVSKHDLNLQKSKPAFISMELSGGNFNPVLAIHAGSAVTGISAGGGSDH